MRKGSAESISRREAVSSRSRAIEILSMVKLQRPVWPLMSVCNRLGGVLQGSSRADRTSHCTDLRVSLWNATEPVPL